MGPAAVENSAVTPGPSISREATEEEGGTNIPDGSMSKPICKWQCR